jgi:hypothetical protein
MPTTMAKMITDDLMIMNDPEANLGVMSWPSFGAILATFSQSRKWMPAGHDYNCIRRLNQRAIHFWQKFDRIGKPRR